MDGNGNVRTKYQANMTAQNDWGNTPLHEAYKHARPELIGLLISHEALKVKNGEGLTPVRLNPKCSLSEMTRKKKLKQCKGIIETFLLGEYSSLIMRSTLALV